MNTSPFDDLINQVMNHLPEGIQTLQADVQRNMRAALAAGLQRLDLVTRQEFEVQRQLLERAQQQLKVLDEKISALEKAVQTRL